jgi:chromosome segregation protein
MARFLKLDRMEIHGFKSFYGRARFEFPSGITAVVGPNGCGKSNIGDAISWVLGEQKASSLRSDRMEDVIFNGSEGRRPLGMAEVSLHFKNAMPRGSALETPAALAGGNGHGADAGGGNGHGDLPAAVLGEVALPIPQASEAADASGEPVPAAEDAADAAPGETPAEARFFLEDLPEDVVVSRRLYRSGESEYALNGERCRLKDIQDLLARTQVGSRLYATIEQGKIDQILTSKPRDRRAIVEEAAGILGYKLKRRQAEQKLEAAQANLLRISDIAGEIEKQIGSLKRQAAKARRYRRLLEAQRAGRLVIVHGRLLSLDEERRQATEAIGSLTMSEAAAAADLARAEADLAALRQNLEEQERAAHQRREEIHAFDMEIDRLQARVRAGEEQAREIAGRVADANAETLQIETRCAEQEERLRNAVAGLAEEQERIAAAEGSLGAIEAERIERAAAIEARAAALDESRARLLRHLDHLSELSRLSASLKEQERSGRASIDRTEREIAETAAGRDDLAATVAALDERLGGGRLDLETRARERAAVQTEETEATDRLTALMKMTEERRARATALAERLEALRALEERHAGFAEGVAEILRGAAGFVPRGVVGEAIEVPDGLERAVAATLGRLVEAVVIEAPEEALRGVGHLRRSGSGRVSFVRGAMADRGPGAVVLPEGLASHPGVHGLLADAVGNCAGMDTVRTTLARTVLVESLSLGLDLREAHPGWAFVTVEGDVVAADGVVTGGEGTELQHGVLARRAERAGIAREIAAIESDAHAGEGALEDARREADARRARQLEAAAALQEAERWVLELEIEVREKRSELSRRESLLPLLTSDRVRLEGELSERETRALEVAAGTASAETERAVLEGEIGVSTGAVATARHELERVQQTSAELKAALAAARQRLSALERERAGVEEGIVDLRARSCRRAEEARDGESRLAAIAEQEKTISLETGMALSARAEAAARDEAALAGLAYDRSLLHAREQAEKDGRQARAALRQRLQEYQLQLARLDSDLGHLLAVCRDDLLISLEELRANPPAREEGRTLEDYEREARETKETLDEIGPVNLMAIEQCAELEERFGFLSAQRKDLEDSIASLRDTIRRINRESRERFLVAFEAIQAGFRECFTTLFGGGQAEMRLQESEEDVLEAGIEIAAQPPGKKLQSIALLSGGEKALTAVALLFALFRYRPSPFCVLDEVDAPLDEANVERFTQLLRQMTDDTQFILITHNRKSMEAANLLYGITMEEPGISKVLPLRFE